MAKVLLVAEPDGRAALQGALEALRLEVVACSPREAATRVKEADLVAVAAFPDDATTARFVGHLFTTHGAACPPVVAQVTEKAAARDAALIAGAADVAFDSSAEHLAGRVAAVVDRWQRGARKALVDVVVPGQSGRTALELKVTDLDLTGLGLASVSGLTPRQLVRLQVPLPTGPLVAWGRVAQCEGVAGVRFLGLAATERARLAEGLESVPQPVDAFQMEAPVHPGPPPAQVGQPESGVEADPIEDEPASIEADLSDPAPEPGPAGDAGEVPGSDEASGADQAPDEVEATDEALEQPSTSPSAKPADPAKAPSDGLSSLIGDALQDEISAGSEGDMLASILDSGLVRRWPATSWATDACVEVLRNGASVGLVSDVEHAPAGETILSFLRTVSPLERRAFDAVPPLELPPAPLTTRCLALRLRCFALVEDARAQKLDGPGWVIDHVPLTALKAEADLARTELQKLADTLMAQGETTRLRDVTNFANALHRAYTDVTVEAARLRGEAVTRDRAVLLDVAENDPEARRATRAKPGKAAEKGHSLSPTARDFRKRTPQQAARRRLIGWCVVLGAAVALRVLLWPEGVKTLDAGDLRAVPGVVEVKLPPAGNIEGRPQAAAVTVVGTWRADDAESVDKLKAFLRAKGAKRFAIFDGTGSLLATGGTGPADRVVVTEIPAP